MKVEGKVVVWESGEKREFESKSKMFEYLWKEEGLSVGEISKVSKNHYSFVYGVVERISEGSIRKVNSVSNSEMFRRMWDEGKSIGEISKELNKNYSFVFSVVDRYRKEKEKE